MTHTQPGACPSFSHSPPPLASAVSRSSGCPVIRYFQPQRGYLQFQARLTLRGSIWLRLNGFREYGIDDSLPALPRHPARPFSAVIIRHPIKCCTSQIDPGAISTGGKIAECVNVPVVCGNDNPNRATDTPGNVNGLTPAAELNSPAR